MKRCTCLLAAVVFLAGQRAAWPQDKAAAIKKLPDGVYAVERASTKEEDVLPLKEGEVLLVHRHRYLNNAEKEAPRFVVVGPRPAVTLDLIGEPRAVKEGADTVRILLKLQPKPAAALERLTKERIGREVAIILAGEVVTMHKIRDVIKGGEVQITSCAAGAADYLLERLQGRRSQK
jgi:preprotein translocase subunit SecD